MFYPTIEPVSTLFSRPLLCFGSGSSVAVARVVASGQVSTPYISCKPFLMFYPMIEHISTYSHVFYFVLALGNCCGCESEW